MPFPRRLLNDNEDIVLDMHPHWWYYGPQAISTVVVSILGLWILGRFDGAVLSVLGYLDLAALLVSGGWLIVELIKWRTTYFVVTNFRVISKVGTLARHGVEIPLDKVNNVNFHQTIFQRLLGVGNLLIESGGKDSAEPFTNISRPETVQNIIHKAMDNRLGQTFRAAPGRADIADQLERLEGLRDRGALTDEEFEQQKRRLLG